MALCGLACRGRFRPFRLWLWFFVLLLAVSCAVAVPVYGIAVVVCSVPLCPLAPFIIPTGLLIAAVASATLLPFLVLSFANPLFRERLKTLLGLRSAVPPGQGSGQASNVPALPEKR
jgi:hypothetical protein